MLVIKTELEIVRLTGSTKLCHFVYKLTRTKNILNILTTTKNSSDLRYLSLRTSLKHILKLRIPKRKAQNVPGTFCNWLSNRYLGLQIFPLLWCCLQNEVDLIRNKVWAQIYSLSPEFWAVAFRFLEGGVNTLRLAPLPGQEVTCLKPWWPTCLWPSASAEREPTWWLTE